MDKSWEGLGMYMYLILCVHCMMFKASAPHMQGLGTNDRVLVRVMVSRCEVDMVQIKKTFYQKYHKTLGSFIKVCDACSADGLYQCAPQAFLYNRPISTIVTLW